MGKEPTFDVEAAHKHFSAACFNAAWDLIEKSDRTLEEDEQMIRLNQASLWHWTQRADGTDKNISIGYWQASRIYALLGQAANALRYAELCLQITPPDETFCLGYAHEALARAYRIAGERDKSATHLAQAKTLADAIEKADDKKLLVDDLATIS